MTPPRVVAFQGEPGAFGEEAARLLLGRGPRLLPCESFAATFAAVGRKADACLIPIENTLAGSVHENYDLLVAHRLFIRAEVSLRVVHCLIAPRGRELKSIRRVLSHPVALAQCAGFFAANPRLEKVPFYDTAGSVKAIVEQRMPDAAAIASRAAAKAYGARVLRRHLEDHSSNYTRFLLLSRSAGAVPGADKTSIVFSVRNEPGALFKALGVFALRDISLAKIESRPIKGRVWEYRFYVDFMGSLREERCRKALDHLRELADFARVLGSYRAWRS
ncbi:MAG TPA: prephenate dehydratase [Elusimicrobiota bacterium]|jgi:prephenate dehydratase|nr:prephenate dehydratase [Elusimicrobiota bacterium]